MSEPTAAEWLDEPVRITRSAVYFGEHKLPGVIASDGITFKPGCGTDINRLTIEFYVGPVTADDPLQTAPAFNSEGFKISSGQ